jgi:hypothetical protein
LCGTPSQSLTWRRRTASPAEADEALADPFAVVRDPDPASGSGKSGRHIGWCASRGEVLVVIIVHEAGLDYGANAWPANPTHQRIYEKGKP